MDDHSRVGWADLLKREYDVCQVVKDFFFLSKWCKINFIQIFKSLGVKMASNV